MEARYFVQGQKYRSHPWTLMSSSLTLVACVHGWALDWLTKPRYWVHHPRGECYREGRLLRHVLAVVVAFARNFVLHLYGVNCRWGAMWHGPSEAPLRISSRTIEKLSTFTSQRGRSSRSTSARQCETGSLRYDRGGHPFVFHALHLSFW